MNRTLVDVSVENKHRCMEYHFTLPVVATTLAVISVTVALVVGIAWAAPASKKMETEEPDSAVPAASALTGKPFESKHYAWAKDIKQREAEMKALGVDMSPKPVKVTDTTSTSGVSQASGVSRSAWNAAGTWEDRDISSRALLALRTRLERFCGSTSGGGFAITSVTSCTGTVTLM